MSDVIAKRGRKQLYLNSDIISVFEDEELTTSEIQMRLKSVDGYSEITNMTVNRRLKILNSLGKVMMERRGKNELGGLIWNVINKPVPEHKPNIVITGIDERPYVIIAKCRASAKASGWSGKKITQFVRLAIRKKKPSLIDTVFEYFTVTIEPNLKKVK